ncbi:hypothetical protein [Pseudomonas juntendi]|uniref:hypothetical protein n=1 Tax=Pseudomonas juntendi TaxID=2666183 RepID=UPI003207968D
MPEEINLIQPAPVVRDKYGMYEHPELSDFDEGDGEKCKAWIAQQSLQLVMVHLETDAPEEIADRYFQSDEPHCGYWEPGKPEGEYKAYERCEYHDIECMFGFKVRRA